MNIRLTRFAAVAVLSMAVTPLFAATETWNIDRGHSQVGFEVRHLMSTVQGKFSDFSGTVTGDRSKPQSAVAEFHVKVASIDTGSADRDKHLQTGDFFDAQKFPEINFKSTSIKPSKKKNVFDVAGDLTMHGVTKHIILPVTLLGFAKDPFGYERAGFSTTVTLNRKDYGVNWNKALEAGGYLVGDDVTIRINLKAINKK